MKRAVAFTTQPRIVGREVFVGLSMLGVGVMTPVWLLLPLINEFCLDLLLDVCDR
jgi:hypothetical protein